MRLYIFKTVTELTDRAGTNNNNDRTAPRLDILPAPSTLIHDNITLDGLDMPNIYGVWCRLNTNQFSGNIRTLPSYESGMSFERKRIKHSAEVRQKGKGKPS